MSSLLVTERYLPHEGGSRRYYHELAARLGNCTVLTGHEPGEKEFDAQSPVRIQRRFGIGYDYRRRWYHSRIAALNLVLVLVPRWAWMMFWIVREFLRERPSAIHAGGYLFPGMAARLLLPALRIPYLVYAHGEEIASAERSRRFLQLFRWVCSGAHAIVANSENTRRIILGHGLPADRVVVAYPGVDPGRVLAAGGNPRQRLGLTGRPLLLSVGRLEEHKGFGSVIQALPRIAERHPEVVYVIVGAGSDEARLRTLARNAGVDGRIRWLGVLTDGALADAYAAADLFVQPNGEVRGISEGYGMVYLEAGAAGLAVIGGRSGGVIEAVEDGVTGILVTPYRQEELLAAVERLLGDEELRRRLAEAGRARARERTWDRTLLPAIRIDRALAHAAGTSVVREADEVSEADVLAEAPTRAAPVRGPGAVRRH